VTIKHIIPLLLLSSCGSSPSDWMTIHVTMAPFERKPVTPTLQLLVDEFIVECGENYARDLSSLRKMESIEYGDPSTKESPFVVGMCMQWYSQGTFRKGNIVVKKLYDPMLNKAIMFHELGHCVLGLSHVEQSDKEIMSPFMMSSSYYEKNWTSLVRNLCLSVGKN
jgi:hypothetical protein